MRASVKSIGKDLLLGAAFLVLWAPLLAQSAPTLLNFQGRLTNSVGAPVTVATSVTFKLLRGGTATEPVSSGTIVYEESDTVTPDTNGVFTHVIGTGTPASGQTLIEEDFDTSGQPLYIEMTAAGEVLLPRTRVLSVPYAIESSRLGGMTAQAIVGQAGGNAFANAVVRNGAGLEWISSSQINVKPGTLGFPDGIVRRTVAALTWDFANPVGLLGLDQGSETADTWYYVYAIPDPGDNSSFTAIASTGTPPQVGGLGPAGYSVFRYLGSFRNDASSNIRRFFRLGQTISHGGRVGAWLYVGAGCVGAQPTVNTWTTIDASGFMPETSRAVIVNGYYDSWQGGTGFQFYVGPGAAPPPVNSKFCVDWENGAMTCNDTIPTINRQFSYYAGLTAGSNNANQCTDFWYTGYVEDLNEF